MDPRKNTEYLVPPPPRTWDGRLARWLVTPLKDTAVVPNQLTTLRLAIGIAGAALLAHGTFRWGNVGAFLIVLSNFVDHTDGELARISGKTSRFGHFYDLASDALITVLLFTCLGIGVDDVATTATTLAPIVLGAVTGVAVALIFFLRMRIASLTGRSSVPQGFAAGFETEDVLYLLPLVTLFDVVAPFLLVAAIGASLFALWVAIDYARVMRRPAWSSR
jgi:archaetidylinositol phosphate synthase